ncbi:uncharacterized protein LOC122852737 [Aphidius gifuensis]|uniref:uncharacterized protein LOC122852737 n=1 Tax=Aphidius gifuensis TaxID=684658 RepID=UPI001CDD85F0|nr:uncharacterized protein LOC122852737 [Aphidius gifuensis]
MKSDQKSTRMTLVRRVSDLFREKNNSGSPRLFNHSSMEKLRHCCQNLNLFPYLLYSLENAKNNQLNFGQLFRIISERIFLFYVNIRQHNLYGLRLISDSKKIQSDSQSSSKKCVIQKFSKFQIEKRKENSLLIILAVYLAPILLAFQLIGIVTLILFGEYTPGFLFLFFSIIFLGYISMKIFTRDTTSQDNKQKLK